MTPFELRAEDDFGRDEGVDLIAEFGLLDDGDAAAFGPSFD